MQRNLTPLCLGLSLVACGSEFNDSGSVIPYIKEGVVASDYPSSCLVDINDSKGKVVALCSGVVIAPNVLLTAGHCVSGFSSFDVICPYLHQRASGVGIPHPRYKVGPNGSIARDSDDIGVIALSSRIVMAEYPTIRATPLPYDSSVVNVGRVLDGVPSRTDLYKSNAIKIRDGKTVGFPQDYATVDRIQAGDSGGGTYLANNKGTPQVVAINSGAGDGFAVLARVDLVYSWVAEQVVANGGFSLPPGYQPILQRSPDPRLRSGE